MSNVNGVNNLNVFDQINQANRSNQTASSGSSEQSDMFMQLMIAQLKNQSPTSPADTTDFMQQISNMSQVESVTNLTKTMEQMSQTMMSSQAALQASSMVGQKAFIETDISMLKEGEPVEGVIGLATSSSDVRLSFYDRSGTLVASNGLGAVASGDQSFSWAGDENTPPGPYRVVAEAFDGEKYVEVPVYIGHRINSVTLGQNGIGMSVNTDAGSASMNEVRQLG